MLVNSYIVYRPAKCTKKKNQNDLYRGVPPNIPTTYFHALDVWNRSLLNLLVSSAFTCFEVFQPLWLWQLSPKAIALPNYSKLITYWLSVINVSSTQIRYFIMALTGLIDLYKNSHSLRITGSGFVPHMQKVLEDTSYNVFTLISQLTDQRLQIELSAAPFTLMLKQQLITGSWVSLSEHREQRLTSSINDESAKYLLSPKNIPSSSWAQTHPRPC